MHRIVKELNIHLKYIEVYLRLVRDHTNRNDMTRNERMIRYSRNGINNFLLLIIPSRIQNHIFNFAG